MKKIVVIGNVGRVPTLRTNSKGTEFYEFSVAVNGKEDNCL
jgi:single-stranded DNA-binding protein